MMYQFREEKKIENLQLLTLYKSVGWSAYTDNPEALIKGIAQSLKVMTAWHNQRLIGLIRVVGDGQTIIYIQDILVHPDYHDQGIGSKLMEKMLDAYQGVRQFVLMTEDGPKVRAFYEKHGFKSCDQGSVVSFAIFK